MESFEKTIKEGRISGLIPGVKIENWINRS